MKKMLSILLLSLVLGCASPQKKTSEDIARANPTQTCETIVFLATKYSQDLYYLACADKLLRECNSLKNEEQLVLCYEQVGPSCLRSLDSYRKNLELSFSNLYCHRYLL